jgi:hypothetical protein
MHIKNKVYCSSLRRTAKKSSLRRTAKKLASRIGPDCDVVLLGSPATGKYVEILNPIFGSRLVAKFIGLGDMSRGVLLLRHVRENRELDTSPAQL